jgi:hypothetical protein
MLTHKQIIALWPTRCAFARAINVSEHTATAWWRRGGIPSEHWLDVVEAAQVICRDDITLFTLCVTQPKRRKRRLVIEMHSDNADMAAA